jgi:hypothetical protein
MPKRRTNKHRGAVNEYEAAWLEGDQEIGFLYSLNHTFVRQELWDRAGDHDAMFWKPGMSYPLPIDEAAFETEEG